MVETISDILVKTELIISTIRAAFPNALAIYVFGSRINDTANAESDLDLAVLVAGYAEPLRLWNVSGDLAEIVGCDVDLPKSTVKPLPSGGGCKVCFLLFDSVDNKSYLGAHETDNQNPFSQSPR